MHKCNAVLVVSNINFMYTENCTNTHTPLYEITKFSRKKKHITCNGTVYPIKQIYRARIFGVVVAFS